MPDKVNIIHTQKCDKVTLTLERVTNDTYDSYHLVEMPNNSDNLVSFQVFSDLLYARKAYRLRRIALLNSDDAHLFN